MDTFSAEPKPPKTKQSIAWLVAIAAFALAGLVPMPVGAQNLLTLLGLGVFGFGAVIGIKHDRAHAKWLSTQPASVDPMRGSPKLPHVTQLIAFLIGIGSIGALCYLGLPLKDGGFTSADWWLLLLSITALGGFGYASKIQKKHNKAYMEWRNTKHPL